MRFSVPQFLELFVPTLKTNKVNNLIIPSITNCWQTISLEAKLFDGDFSCQCQLWMSSRKRFRCFTFSRDSGPQQHKREFSIRRAYRHVKLVQGSIIEFEQATSCGIKLISLSRDESLPLFACTSSFFWAFSDFAEVKRLWIILLIDIPALSQWFTGKSKRFDSKRRNGNEKERTKTRKSLKRVNL